MLEQKKLKDQAKKQEERRNLEFALALQREEIEAQNDIMYIQHIEEMADPSPNPDNMTYEQLIELGDEIGKVSRGYTEKEIKSIPKKKFYKSEKVNDSCSICMTKQEYFEDVLELKCKHCFHAECIEKWLKTEKTCPICKNNAI